MLLPSTRPVMVNAPMVRLMLFSCSVPAILPLLILALLETKEPVTGLSSKGLFKFAEGCDKLIVKVEKGALLLFNCPDQLPFTVAPIPLAEVLVFSPQPLSANTNRPVINVSFTRLIIFI